MKTLTWHLFAILILSCFTTNGFTQTSGLDSLWDEFKNAKHDTTRIILLNEGIGNHYLNINPDSAIVYYNQAISIADKAIGTSKPNKNNERFFSLKANSLRFIGVAYYFKGNNNQAIKYFMESSKLAEEIVDKQQIAVCYNNIGIIHRIQGNYDLAIEYYHKALIINKELNNQQIMSANYNNIGNVHYHLGNYDHALNYFIESLKIKEETGDKRGVAVSYVSIGNVHKDRKSYNQANEYYHKSLQISKELDDKRAISGCYNNIGLVHREQGNYEQAIEYFNKSLLIAEETGDKMGITRSYNNIGVINKKKGSYDNALENFQMALKTAKEIGDKNEMSNIYGRIANLHILIADSLARVTGVNERTEHLSIALEYGIKSIELAREIKAIPRKNETAQTLMQAYKKLGNHKKALEYADIFITTKDSMFREEKTKAITEMQTRYETEKKQQEIYKQRLVIESQEIDNKRQRAQKNYFIAGSTLMALLLMVVINGYLQKKRRNTVITEKNVLLEQANEEINAQKDEIESQRDMVITQKTSIEKQKEKITDSIAYARFIQTAVLPSAEYTINILGDHFILFKPKEIVSGDFYWATQIKDLVIFVVADCTGHGVPGAFMSMLGMSFLKEIINKKEITKPGKAIDLMRENIIEALQQKGRFGDQSEGLNMALCVLNRSNNLLQYSGARTPLHIINKNNKLETISPDKQPVAIYRKMKPFTNHEITLEKGDRIYLASDGYQDQFGGPDYKRFSGKKLKELLVSIASQPMEQQKNILDQTFENWKGKNEQVDDVTILGMKL